jgi:molecular chaperone DnaJ
MTNGPTLYDLLGIAARARPDEIRQAYRRAAREHHPDTHGEASAGQMAEINRAWYVLGDPQRRREYDIGLGVAPGVGPRVEREPVPAFTEPRHNPLARYQDPPRIPWRFLAGLFVLGVAFVVLGVVTASDPVPPTVDNVLEPGDCVVIDDNGDAVERLCGGLHDGTVEELVPFDARCSAATEPHRDRQGMGTACVLLLP